MSTSEAMKKAIDKYQKNTSQINTRINSNINDLFVEYCKQCNLTKKEALEKMITYYIDHN